MRILGIDIGSYSIKVAELESTERGNVLKDFYEFELSHDPSQDIRFDKIEFIKKIVAQYDLNSYRTVIGLGSEFATARVLDFPFFDRRKILQSLPFELEDNIPFSQNEAIFDFRTLSVNQNSSRVLAMAVPKKYIQEILGLCEDGGLDPDIISLDSIAFSNLHPREYTTINTDDAFSSSEVYIHIGYKKTLLNITKNGGVIASRAIYFGGQDLANAISRVYELPYIDALRGVADKGFVLSSPEGADEDQVAFSKTITDSLSLLITDIKRTLVDLKAESNLTYHSATVSGGMSGLINLGPYLTQELGIPTQSRASMELNFRTEIALSQSSEKAGAVAVGLALEASRKPKSPAINLRKNEFSKQSQNLKLFFDRNKTLMAGLAAVFVVFFIYTFIKGSFANDNLDAIEQVVNDQTKANAIGFTKAQTKPEAMQKFIKNKKQELEGRKEVIKLNQMSSALDVLKSISSAVPSKDQIKLDIHFFKIDNERTTLEGNVASEAEFNLLQRKLSSAPGVSGLKLGPAPKADTGKYFFQVSFNVKRNKARDIK